MADTLVQLVSADPPAVHAQARTDINGRAELFLGPFGEEVPTQLEIQVGSGDSMTTLPLQTTEDATPIAIALEQAESAGKVLDVMFVIDTTGSMGDELSYLQAELENVMVSVQDRHDEIAIRLGSTFYRDSGDDYLVRSVPFTEDLDTALTGLRAQRADGGGDYPEAVTAGLTDAIDEHEWSTSAQARLLFLVLDAPPHALPDRIEQLHALTLRAQAKGIRIIPVASSGVDRPTEMLMRAMAVATGGTYTFLTNHSGIGGDHLEPTIGDYEVEYLDSLLIRLVAGAVTPR